MDDPSDIAQVLEWDSQFFGKRIGKVTSRKLTPALAIQINDWALIHHVECLYFLGSANDRITSITAENYGYHLTDIRVTLTNKMTNASSQKEKNVNIRVAEEKDIVDLRQIAHGNHRDSRFYYDGHFNERKCDELYEIWIEKSVRGESDQVLVYEESNHVVGYVTAKVLPNRHGSIDLLGVASGFQGRGVGSLLIYSILDWFWNMQIPLVSVVTQARNIKAQALYQRYGFTTSSVELWFHKWFI